MSGDFDDDDDDDDGDDDDDDDDDNDDYASEMMIDYYNYVFAMTMMKAMMILYPNHFQTTWQNESGTGHSTGLKVLRQSCIPVYR